MRKAASLVTYGVMCLAALACVQQVAVHATPVGSFNATQTRKFDLGTLTGQVFPAFSGGGSFAAFGLPRKDQVRVYTRLSSDWLTDPSLQTVLPDTGGAIKFGKAVELDSNDVLLAVSAPGFASNAGAVYIYNQNASFLFDLNTRLEEPADSQAPGRMFGSSFCMSGNGNKVFVSLRPGQGGFYYFIRDQFGSGFGSQGTITNVTTTPASQSLLAGTAMACSEDGKFVAYSAATWTANQGAVWIFKHNDTDETYVQTQQITVASTQLFGSDLSMSDSGSILVVGSRRANNANAHVFALNEGTGLYALKQTINSPQVGGDSNAVSSVTVGGTGRRIIVGDPAYGGGTGALFAYVRLDDTAQFLLYSNEPVQGTAPSSAQGASSDLDEGGDALLFADSDYNSGRAWIFEAITDTNAPTATPGTGPGGNSAPSVTTTVSIMVVALAGWLAAAF